MVGALGLLIDWSRFTPWAGPLYCVLRKDTFLSQCLTPSRGINGRSSEFNAGGRGRGNPAVD